ncbi:heterokaryon incompatibility protein [Colletotrichum orchidophilum]|uniref:Heterokaryon incompatibility protein n=1 Tax=Colletotrichum orchidophilum TaxID=1209926 RepID=A0A1G4BRS9_9PEZI|nr:heterokaryon incompatibility protein [Colletotrichum orchidophilum]OHF04101.1 heterokaryon incompatibility protein [Colletotrichum orchidophilum]
MSSEERQWIFLLKDLKNNHFTDDSLPITFNETRNALRRKKTWTWHSSEPRDPLHIHDWGRIQKSLFELYQWKFMAPTFGTGQNFRSEFHQKMILPYVEHEARSVNQGFFGEVSKVNIHLAHVKPPEGTRITGNSVAIALKKANDDPGLREYFDKEAYNLEELRKYKSNHLIKPIAAYEHGDDRCLLFPWAEGGNLAQYWSRNTGKSLTRDEHAWIFGQLAGLFGALEELHKKNCRHGDLKPENILLFIDMADKKTLQIADLGLTTFHDQDAATRIRRAKEILTLTPPGTSRYEPPEMDKDRDKKIPAHETRSRAYDIWSMGCVVLELLIWLAHPDDTVEIFRKGTAYFWERAEGKEKKYRVQSETRRQINALSTKLPARSVWRELLTLVETRLLVVKVSENSNVSSHDCRETASAAHREMRRLQAKYYPVTMDGRLSPGRDYERNGINPSLSSQETNLDEFDGLVGIERKATEDLEPNSTRSLAKGNDFEVNAKLEEEHIDFYRLPKTFQDAITVTRGLGVDYIWIDTLCIIQNDMDDWENESTKMEEVFSAAYCTISAASAKSSLDGFLSDRPPRPSVHLRFNGSPDLYVCRYIDDFHQDVELAEINRRGWVLQERALSRRSIYFTPKQVYWECGHGIRCETLSLLYNSKAAFLGDANFPKSALDYYKDGRQLLIQDLYERYSALEFTVASDRAVAILGLQTRLARALKTKAAHGSFEKYFARNILWKRAQTADMTAIAQSTWLVPTWSWFSKSGKIQYMQLAFDKIDWANGDFESPFSRHPDMLSGGSYFGRDKKHTILRGVARRMDMSEEQIASQIVFDKKNERKAEDLRVVIIGRDKEGLDARAHVLVICKSQNDSQHDRYERVGVASLLEKQVSEEGLRVDIG